jgi:hypothetical protein
MWTWFGEARVTRVTVIDREERGAFAEPNSRHASVEFRRKEPAVVCLDVARHAGVALDHKVQGSIEHDQVAVARELERQLAFGIAHTILERGERGVGVGTGSRHDFPLPAARDCFDRSLAAGTPDC